MSAHFSFAAARPVANHCAQLFARGRTRDVSAGGLSAFGGRLAARLAAQLAPFLGTGQVRVSCTGADSMTPQAFLAADGPMVMAAIDVPDAAGTLVGTVAGGDLARVTERLFGGEGPDDVVVPDELPLTARLVAERLHALLAVALGQTIDADGRVRPVSRVLEPGEAPPLERQDRCGVVVLTVEQPGAPPWTIKLAACPAAQRELFRNPRSDAQSPAVAISAAVPVELRAVVAEVPLPLARLSRLRTGDLVPFVMPRSVALKIGDLPFAEGAAGAVDGQASLRLTRVS